MTDDDITGRRWIVAAFVVILLVGAIYQLLVAVRAVPLGDEPGEGSPLAGVFMAPAALILLVGGFALLPIGLGRAASSLLRSGWARSLPLAVAAFVLTRGASFDPYYVPTLRRFWDAGDFARGWVIGVTALCVGVSIAMTRRPRGWTMLATAVLMVLAAWTVIVVGLH